MEGLQENKITKIIFNQVSLFIACVGVVSSVMFWVMNPQQDMQIELTKLKTQMESNQTVTDALDRIKANDLHEIQLRMDQIEARQIEEMKATSRVEALLTQHMR
jgi:hypothetical protein